MDPVSAALINRSLDGLSMRIVATAENIANANSRNFAPVRVRFEDALRAASTQGVDAIRQVTPRMESDPSVRAGTEMRVDLELATASATAMRYSALLDLLSRQMQISRIVIRGGQ